MCFENSFPNLKSTLKRFENFSKLGFGKSAPLYDTAHHTISTNCVNEMNSTNGTAIQNFANDRDTILSFCVQKRYFVLLLIDPI